MKRITLTLLTAASAVLASGLQAPAAMAQQQVDVRGARTTGETLAEAVTREDAGSAFLSRHAEPSVAQRPAIEAQYHAAVRRGEVPAMTAEDSGSFYLMHGGQVGSAPMQMASY